MRRADLVIVISVVALGGFIGYQVLTGDGASTRTRDRQPADTAALESGASPDAVVIEADSAAAPPRDVVAIREKLRSREHGTFIAEILVARDSNIARWAERKSPPVRVWIDQRTPLLGGKQQIVPEIRRAFADWGIAGVPVDFTYVDDSARAEVKITFVERFDEALSGRTLWTRDTNWWILRGDIQLALRSPTGATLSSDQVYAIALHEIGHLLGLDHTADSAAVMAPRIRAAGLTPTDVATMRLIYDVPPGSVKQPPRGRRGR